MLSVKQGRIKYHFLSLWYDSTCDWTPVSQTIGEQSKHKDIESEIGIKSSILNGAVVPVIIGALGMIKKDTDKHIYKIPDCPYLCPFVELLIYSRECLQYKKNINNIHNQPIGLLSRMFASGPGDWGSIPGRVMPKTQKIVLDISLRVLSYVSRVKWSNPGKRVMPTPTSRCSSYWKGSFLVALDSGCQLYFAYILSIT